MNDPVLRPIRSFADVFQQLKEESREAASPTIPARLPLSQIKTAEEVFQPRDISQNFLATDGHVKTLAEVIKDAEGNAPFDPITVWWSGVGWYVIDGHHRLMAYHLASETDPELVLTDIRVEPFVGTFEEAIAQSSTLNAKDKLPMTKADKLERAWKMVCLQGFTKDQIREATTISLRTIANMRAEQRQLVEAGKANLLELTWQDVKAAAGPVNRTDEWQERQAKEWAKRLVKTFGPKLAKQPEIAARALELYSEPLVENLVRNWLDQARQLIEDEPDTPAF